MSATKQILANMTTAKLRNMGGYMGCQIDVSALPEPEVLICGELLKRVKAVSEKAARNSIALSKTLHPMDREAMQHIEDAAEADGVRAEVAALLRQIQMVVEERRGG